MGAEANGAEKTKRATKMTLPTISTFSSTAFNNFDTMSSLTTTLNDTVDTVTPPQLHLQTFPQAHLRAAPLPFEPIPNNVPLHVATASTSIYSSQDLGVECIMPGIYLSKNFMAWNEDNLRAHGFTHIIIIDKHIQELYYPSPLFKLSTTADFDTTDDSFNAPAISSSSSLKFGQEFEVIDLNFGEKSYLTTVLPNCYRAVRFLNKALDLGRSLLVIDCNGGEQKCVTIVVAYLMYKYNINFCNAFARLKEHYKKADLDRFYTNQLYEYEPILQVQRAQSRSHSRALHSAILKRKNVDNCHANTNEFFLDSLNPLTQFNASATTQQQYHQHHQQQQQQNLLPTYSCSSYSWDDYSME